MLSRIAESLFWIGRYLERAEDTARILDVHVQLLIEDPTVDEESAARALLAVMGAETDAPPTLATVLRVLCYDAGSPCSVVAALEGARESARRSRETVPSEMWEGLNTTWNALNAGQLAAMRPSAAFRMVRERCAVVAGIADSTMSRDEEWHFLVLGRTIERVDMTARLVCAAALSTGSVTAWPNALRACGAHHAFTRTYRGMASDSSAATFLILDRLFPRAIVHTLSVAEAALAHLDTVERRAGFEADAARLIGMARAELEYTPVPDLLADLPGRMTRLQAVCAEVSRSISARYFEGAVSATWHEGAQ